MKRIGLLGGTFDPVHDGHIQLALAAENEFQLDKVLFIPAADPPHKQGKVITAFHHRKEMLHLALQGAASLEISLIEYYLPKPSYTIDTVKKLLAESGKDIELFFIAGLDSLADITNWKSYRELLSLINLIIANRPGQTALEMIESVGKEIGYTCEGNKWYGSGNLKDIFFLNEFPVTISSSHLREQLRKQYSHISCLDSLVLKYITRHNLYK